MAKLYDLSKIRAGYSFRGTIPNASGGNISIVQFKDFSKNGKIDYSSLNKFSPEKMKNEAFLKKGDILLSSRGTFKAALFEKDITAIASGALFVLTVCDSAFLPEYVSLYLNSKQGQAQLMSFNKSGTVLAITRKDIEQIYIPPLPIELQKKLITFYSLLGQETEILEKLQKNRKILFDTLLTKSIGDYKCLN